MTAYRCNRDGAGAWESSNNPSTDASAASTEDPSEIATLRGNSIPTSGLPLHLLCICGGSHLFGSDAGSRFSDHRRISDLVGDHLGYDVRSFEADGQERLMDIKTANSHPCSGISLLIDIRH